MKIKTGFILKKILPVFGGALLGYAYYYFIGCYSRTCPITSSPVMSTFYGALIAFILVLPAKKKNEKPDENK